MFVAWLRCRLHCSTGSCTVNGLVVTLPHAHRARTHHCGCAAARSTAHAHTHCCCAPAPRAFCTATAFACYRSAPHNARYAAFAAPRLPARCLLPCCCCTHDAYRSRACNRCSLPRGTGSPRAAGFCVTTHTPGSLPALTFFSRTHAATRNTARHNCGYAAQLPGCLAWQRALSPLPAPA